MTATTAPTYSKMVSDKKVSEDFITFDGVRDERGRVMGVRVKMYATEYAITTSEYGACYQIAPGRYVHVYVQQTRNGQRYGASQSGAMFNTLEEAKAYADAVVIKRRKEYTKKYAAN